MVHTQRLGYRPRDSLLRVPRVMGRSHGRTQKDLLRGAVAPEKSRFNRLVDYLKIQWLKWAWHYVRSRFGRKWPFAEYTDPVADDGIYVLSASFDGGDGGEAVTVALVGDWGSGTEDANEIARLIERADPHFTIHLGDVYYVGTRQEIRENMLGERVTWPIGSRGSFALNSNHEMYARGKGYFEYLLPELGVRAAPDAKPAGQKASFFCLRNEHWSIIGLDTGYHSVGIPFIEKIVKPSCKLDGKLIRWLNDVLRLEEDRSRGIVLLSHHQYYSQFEDLHERAARQLSRMLDRPVLWYWGHEHRLALYGRHATKKGRLEAYGRCLGHGGLPIEDITHEPKSDARHRVGLVFYDRREAARIGRDGKTPVGFNGFALLEFRGESLTVEYRDIEDRTLVREQWRVERDGRLGGVSIRQLVLDEGLIVHTGDLEDAQR